MALQLSTLEAVIGLEFRLKAAKELRGEVLRDIDLIMERTTSQTTCNTLVDDLVERRSLEVLRQSFDGLVRVLEEEKRDMMYRLTCDAKLLVCENMQERLGGTVNEVKKSRELQV